MNLKKYFLNFSEGLKIQWKRLWKYVSERPDVVKSRRSEFLQSLFGTGQIALLDELINSWELPIVKLLNWSPKHDRGDANITDMNSLVKRVSKIRFLQSMDGGETNQSQIDVSFVRYHSTALLYAFVRLPLQFFIWVVVFILISLPAAYLIGAMYAPFRIVNPVNEGSVGIEYTADKTADYYVLVRSQGADPNPYSLGVQSEDSTIVYPDIHQGMVWSLDYGQEIFATISSSDLQHIYELKGIEGQTIFVQPYVFYTDKDMKFQIMNSDMSACSNVVEVTVSFDSSSIMCKIQQAGSYFITVEPSQELQIGSTAHYGFSVNSSETQNQSNHSQPESFRLLTGKFIQGTVVAPNSDWYIFSANENQSITLFAYPKDKDSFSLTLYRDTPQGLQMMAFSNQSVRWRTALPSKILDTARGRSVFYFVLLNIVGIHPSGSWLIENDLSLMWYFEFGFALLLILLIRGFFALDWLVSPRRYINSAVVNLLVKVLELLDDDDILHSESKKARLREAVRDVVRVIPDIHGRSRSPWARQPRNIKRHFENIAATILQTNDSISMPDASTLNDLRNKFTCWLALFMKEEYGSIDVQPRKLPWYHPIVSVIQRYWVVGIIGVIVVGFVLASISKESPQVAESILTFGWLVIRYMLLAGIVMAIYLQFGHPEDDTRPSVKWVNGARFILFFLLPLVALDAILDTHILSTLISLISSVKVF